MTSAIELLFLISSLTAETIGVTLHTVRASDHNNLFPSERAYQAVVMATAQQVRNLALASFPKRIDPGRYFRIVEGGAILAVDLLKSYALQSYRAASWALTAPYSYFDPEYFSGAGGSSGGTGANYHVGLGVSGEAAPGVWNEQGLLENYWWGARPESGIIINVWEDIIYNNLQRYCNIPLPFLWAHANEEGNNPNYEGWTGGVDYLSFATPDRYEFDTLYGGQNMWNSEIAPYITVVNGFLPGGGEFTRYAFEIPFAWTQDLELLTPITVGIGTVIPATFTFGLLFSNLFGIRLHKKED